MTTDTRTAPADAATPPTRRRSRMWIVWTVILILAIIFPFIVDRPRFWVSNIGVKSLWLGIIAMSLVFLNKYVGLLSLAQMTVAGIAAYGVGFAAVTLGWPDVAAIGLGVLAGTLGALITALVAARTKAIYFLMITLALGQVFSSWASQSIEVTNARRGLAPITRGDGGILDFRDLNVFYYTVLLAAVACYLLCRYIASTPFGYALQGIRDSPERMSALGYPIVRYRVLAITFAGFIASIGGVILAFDRSQVDPDVVSLGATLDILVVAVIGGIGSLGGVFAGGLFLTLLDNFAGDVTDRYLTLTGLIFILVLYFAPAGLAGIAAQIKTRFTRKRSTDPAGDAPAVGASAPSRGHAIEKGNSNEADQQD
ncbi:branched-chain amino acid ABC transporter permease [Microbacterium sp. SSW1-59]|uniref:branched-chain amino acid ABC transporter permease n=1 Tax=Microbacterium xanthum TaxID=3079794 RepID=UPI002AD1FDDA|nr:branched-chain amino acid ABC transporter permease [Microbacterium sp. SSW1-59]MDZ8200934.1 branched-chain amino acid ABC transporter permease [Microbacterium sp. SSW1-59]